MCILAQVNPMCIFVIILKLCMCIINRKDAQSHGGVLEIEFIENKFCAMLCMLNKYDYVEIILCQIERKYS